MTDLAEAERLPLDVYCKALKHVVRKDPARNRVVVLAVRRGRPGSQQALVDLLQRYRDHWMIYLYLNANSARLRIATEQWAEAHYVQIFPNSLSPYRVWWGNF